MKNKFYKHFTYDEIHVGYSYMKSELAHLPSEHPLNVLFYKVWFHFVKNHFQYDGATFVKERTKETVFEVASFIHDWRNSLGYVSLDVDKEFYDIMICLNYDYKIIVERVIKTRLTLWFNKLRHKFFLKDLKAYKPHDLYYNKQIFINP